MSVCDAINCLNLISMAYDRYTRIVEPHTRGIDTKGNLALRAYQISGGSESGEDVGWKLFVMDRAHAVTILKDKFSGPRQEYKRGDKGFSTILCQL